MNVAIDVSPLEKNSAHAVRGSGFYLKHLLAGLEKISTLSIVEFVGKDHVPPDMDLIHFPYFEPFFLTLPRRRNYKTVVTVHDLTPIIFPNDFPIGIKGKVKWYLQKQSLRSIDIILTDSQSSKDDIIKYVEIAAKKIHVIPLAAAPYFKKIVFTEKQKEMVRQKYALPEKFVLYVGDVTANKNLPRLINAVKTLNIPLFLVGKALVIKEFDVQNPWNRDRIEVEKLIENQENIKRLGYVPDDELVMLYNLATVFVLPSLYEGFGLPVLEAMSCGTPVVTTREGSLPEVAGDAAIYVDAYDEKSIAEGIEKVYENNNLQKKLSDKGLSQSANFTWKKTAELTAEAYSSSS